MKTALVADPARGRGRAGVAATALLTRLQARESQDRGGAAVRAVESHLTILADMPRVSVVLDANPGFKGVEGAFMAASLVDWLCAGDVGAGLATLSHLCPDSGG